MTTKNFLTFLMEKTNDLNCWLFIFGFLIYGNGFSMTYYVSATGNASNLGSINSPWSLQHALGLGGVIVPGDSIIVLAGVYNGRYTSTLNGSLQNPITIKGEDRFTTILDGTVENLGGVVLTINGSYTNFYDLQITCTYNHRISSMGGTPSDIITVTGINIFGVGTKVINCIVQNIPGVGIGYWKTSLDAELYGNVVFHNGWAGTDRGHGHAFYTQNDDGSRPKYITNNFAFSQFGNNIDIYVTNPKNKGIHVVDNICFNTGAPIQPNKERKYNLIVGGVNNTTSDIVVQGNIFFRDSTDNGSLGSRQNVKLGYSFPDSNIIFSENQVFGDCHLTVRPWHEIQFENNTIFRWNPNSSSNPQIINLENSPTPTSNWDHNLYSSENSTNLNLLDGMSLSNWQTQFGADINSVLQTNRPTNSFIKIVKNVYDTTMYYVSILNYEELNSIDVSLTDLGLPNDVKVDVYDVQNYINGPFLSNNSITENLTFPMNLTDVYPIYGEVPSQYKHTSKLLGTFIVKVTEWPTNSDLSLSKLDQNLNLVFPNPSNDGIFHFQQPLIGEVTIFDNLGRIIRQFQSNNTKVIDLSNHVEGIYNVRIYNEKNISNLRLIYNR